MVQSWQSRRNLSTFEKTNYIIKCETDHQSRLDAWDKCSGLVHWDDPEGWDREGGGRGFRMGNTCKSMADSCQCMAKTTKNKQTNKKHTKNLRLEKKKKKQTIKVSCLYLYYYSKPKIPIDHLDIIPFYFLNCFSRIAAPLGLHKCSLPKMTPIPHLLSYQISSVLRCCQCYDTTLTLRVAKMWTCIYWN